MYARLGMNKGSRIVNFNFKEFLGSCQIRIESRNIAIFCFNFFLEIWGYAKVGLVPGLK